MKVVFDGFPSFRDAEEVDGVTIDSSKKFLIIKNGKFYRSESGPKFEVGSSSFAWGNKFIHGIYKEDGSAIWLKENVRNFVKKA